MMMPSTTRARTPATIRISVAVSMFLSFLRITGNPESGSPEKSNLLHEVQLVHQRDNRRAQNHHHKRGKDEEYQRRNHFDAGLGAHLFSALPPLYTHVVGINP